VKILRCVLILAIIIVASFGIYTYDKKQNQFDEGIHDPFTGQRYEQFADIEAFANANILIIFAYFADDELCQEAAAQVTKVAEYTQSRYGAKVVVMTSGVGEPDRAIRRFAERYYWREYGVVTIAGVPPNDRTNVPLAVVIVQKPLLGVAYMVAGESFEAEKLIETVNQVARYIGIYY